MEGKRVEKVSMMGCRLLEPKHQIYKSITAPNPTQSSKPTPATAPPAFLLFSAPDVFPLAPVVADLEGKYSEN
jgi:hypothetical protein